MAQTEQEILIGQHPVAPQRYGVWLNATDLPTTGNKKHRMLEENTGMRNAAIDKERGDGFSDLKVQSVAVQSCFTNNRSQQ